VCFTKTDFCRKDKWIEFLQYIRHNKQNLENWKKKYRRLQNRHLTMQTILRNLKKQKLLSNNVIATLEVNIQH